jgi:hypothetical protein
MQVHLVLCVACDPDKSRMISNILTHASLRLSADVIHNATHLEEGIPATLATHEQTRAVNCSTLFS